MTSTNSSHIYSLEESTKLGEKIYFEKLKEKLEKTHFGSYVVIDGESGKYFLNKDLRVALEKAKKTFPDKLFFIVQIGNLQPPPLNLKREKYAWLF